MPLRFYGNYAAFAIYYQTLFNGTASDSRVWKAFMTQVRTEMTNVVKFGAGVIKGFGFPIGFLFQVLTLIFLIRGNSGYSRSARNWFILVVSADIASTLYRVYELVTQDFALSNPDSNYSPANDLISLMWGLRNPNDGFLQNAMCKVFFIILYFPIYLSPIALTFSSLIRCYSIKYPLQAKAVLTKCLDKSLMVLSSFLALAIAMVLGGLLVEGISSSTLSRNVLGTTLMYGTCAIPTYDLATTNVGLQFAGYTFMLAVVFMICLFNFISAIIIVMVLFKSRKDRMLMTSSEGSDSKSEARATAKLLGMNVTLFICFFLSRLLIVISTRINFSVDPVSYVYSERMGSYLFTIPYYTNSMFIAGFSRKFYEFFFQCITRQKVMKSSSSDSRRTL